MKFSTKSKSLSKLFASSMLAGLLTACGGGGNTGIADLVFASGYSALSATELDAINYAYQGLTTEEGSFNWTVADPGSYGWNGSDFWWHGVAASTDPVPNFYWGGAGKENQAYMESWVNAPGNSTVTLSGQTKLHLVVWGNPELNGSPRFTPVIQLSDNGSGCYPRAEASALTPVSASADDGVYEVNLSDFTVTEDCGTATTVGDFMQQPIGSVRIRIYKENYYTNQGVYGEPNGINLGPITFKP